MQFILGILTFVVLIGVCYGLSENRKKVSWKLVGWAIGLQITFALIILKTSVGQIAFGYLNDIVLKLLSFSSEGAKFVFGDLGTQGAEHSAGFIFAFQALPTIIFFSAFMTILYHLGVMQRIVYVIALLMQKTMGTSGAESLSAAANIFVGQTEAPLVIKPYVKEMTDSELMAIMTGGMATIAGGVMALYVGMLKDVIPNIAGHLIAASVMAAPAGLMFAKILVPEQGTPVTGGKIELKIEKVDANVVDACSRGCSEGMSLAINVAAMLVGFLALIAMLDSIWGLIAPYIGLAKYNTLPRFLGLLLSPIALLIGVPQSDMIAAGQLIGEKTILNELVAYSHLAEFMSGKVVDAAGNAIMLHEKTAIIMSYALCGFANVGSIGIQIGGIGAMAPEKRSTLARLAFKALIAAVFAALLVANIAGICYTPSSVNSTAVSNTTVSETQTILNNQVEMAPNGAQQAAPAEAQQTTPEN